jgi:membrane-associated phospholipid phosphatase
VSGSRGPVATEWRPADRRTAAAALAAYVLLAAAFRGSPGSWERHWFEHANHDAGNHPLLRVPQQLGTPWTLPLLALTGFVTHRPHLTVAAGLALPLVKALEVGVKKRHRRDRPAQDDPDVRLHDDAPTDGPSFPSGHAAIATSVVALAAPHLPRPVAALATGAALLSSWVRVRQGAHWPSDAAGGIALGLFVACGLRAILGRSAGG